MAVGDITQSTLSTYEFDTVKGKYISPVHISGNIYAAVYQGADNHGFLRTFTIAADGTITQSHINSWEFDTVDNYAAALVHVSGDVYAIIYGGTNYDGIVKTCTIDSSGNITDLSDSYTFETGSCLYPYVIKCTGNIYAVVYEGAGATGELRTLTISDAGVITDAVAGTKQFESSVNRPKIINVSGNIYAVAYGVTGKVKTYNISDVGVVGNELDSHQFETSIYSLDILHISGNVFAIAYGYYYPDGRINTITISTDGTSIADVASGNMYEFDGVRGTEPNLIAISGDVYAVAYSGPDEDGWLRTLTISATGSITQASISNYEFDTDYCFTPTVMHRDGNVYAIFNSAGSYDGFIKTVTIETAGVEEKTKDINSDAHFWNEFTKNILTDAILYDEKTKTILSNATLFNEFTKTILSDSVLFDEFVKTINADSHLWNELTKTILSNAILYGVLTKTINSDAIFWNEFTKTINSDAYLRAANFVKDIFSNAILYAEEAAFDVSNAIKLYDNKRERVRDNERIKLYDNKRERV